ncbi:hypothetical protein IFR05_011582 [Cadophora sp. M221]|nr:hypothetical protein IFR05_011582 [Cadophora sp. M221]
MALRQTMNADNLARVMESAVKECPIFSPSEALQEYAKIHRVNDIFFIDNDGNRCIRTHNYTPKSSSSKEDWRRHEYEIQKLNYRVDHFGYIPLKLINRPRGKKVVKIFEHASEKG